MAGGFFAVPASKDSVAELSSRLPANVFATAEYFAARRQLHDSVWVLGMRAPDGALRYGAGAFLRNGRINTTMEVTSLPTLGATDPFWSGVREFCAGQGVTLLDLGTFGSDAGGEIPVIGTHYVERERCEFVIDLSANLVGILGSNHKRNVKRGQKSGLVMQRTRSREGAENHQRLMSLSMNRRRDRGEDIQFTPSPDIIAFLDTSAGELFQAVQDTTVLSSVLVLRSKSGAYYQTAGTSPEGMSAGASHFLIHNIATELAAEGVTIFNLGGGDAASTLARFKEGFGATPVKLKAATSYTGSALRRKVARVLELATTERATLRKLVLGERHKMFVYTTDPKSVVAPQATEGLEFRAFSSEDLQAIAVDDAEFRERQLNRLQRFDGSFAYGVVADGKLSHISWLLPPKAITRDIPQVLQPNTDEAEITCCETLPGFRGRGIYGYAISNLLQLAKDQGVRRVFMKTDADNKASQSGIEKAGLQRVGSATLIVLPLTQRTVTWRHFK